MNNPRRRDIWLAHMGEARGSEAEGLRPVIVIQADFLNGKALKTCLCVPLTSQLSYARARGNVVIPSDEQSGLRVESVAIPHLTRAVNKDRLRDHLGRLSEEQMVEVEAGLAYVTDLTFASISGVDDIERGRM